MACGANRAGPFRSSWQTSSKHSTRPGRLDCCPASLVHRMLHAAAFGAGSACLPNLPNGRRCTRLQVLAHPHHLLVTLLLTNALAMEALPIFLDRLLNPVAAILISVTAILFFGEVRSLASRPWGWL